MVEAEDDTTAVFPVVLYDGEREMSVGDIKIHPDLVFKEFQTRLSQMIGISYNNLTTYLVDSKKPKVSPDRRKILITGKVNFGVIVREKDCYFLVVLKRSRRDRRRKPSVSPDDLSRFHLNQLDMNANDARLSGFNPYYYEDQFHNLMLQRENYVKMMLNSRYEYDSRLNMNFPRIEDAYPRVQNQTKRNPNRSLCEDCTEAQKQGKQAEFHLCVYDDVIVGVFRSPAGPIARRR